MTTLTKPRDARLDLLRALSIVFVLIWHTQPVRVSAVPGGWAAGVVAAVTLGLKAFYWQISLLAVPTFLVVSLYLFFTKSSGNSSYVVRRLKRIVGLYLFWTACQFIAYAINSAVSPGEWQVDFATVQTWTKIVFEGGPPLLIGDSVFYFLFALAVLTVLAGLYDRLGKSAKVWVGWVVVVGSLLHFEIAFVLNTPIPYWRVDSFLLYIPVAYAFCRGDKLPKYRWHFLVAMLLCVVYDQALRRYVLPGHRVSIYARTSLFLGVLALVSFVWQRRPDVGSAVSAGLSRMSLGLFATHKYWQAALFIGLSPLFAAKGITMLSLPGGARIDALQAAVGFGTIGMTILTVWLIRRGRLQKFL